MREESKINSLFDATDWPWVGNSTTFPEKYQGNLNWPKLSIVIPSFNQGAFIEETIRSVLFQNYPNLELIVIDGGSKDNTVEILKKYEASISYWVSEPDKGQSHAINKGFKKASGEWIAWINSDDCYLKNAFYHVFVENNPEGYDFLYGNYLIGESLKKNREVSSMSSSKISLRRVLCFFYGIDYILPSQSVFVKSSILKKAGLLNEDLHYCMDLDWYARILLLKPLILKYKTTICFFRYNEHTKTSQMARESFYDNKMIAEAEAIGLNYANKLSFFERLRFSNLYHYYQFYPRDIQRHENSGLGYLLKVVMRHPLLSLSDRRLLGLIKRKLFVKS